MKKLAIAGASVALAAMPIVSTFAATTTVTDHLTVTVSEQCQLGTTNPAEDPTTGVNGYYFATVTAGQAATAFTPGTDETTGGGSTNPTSITINCNSAGGYKITPTFTALHSDVAGNAQDITYDGSADTPTAGHWTAYYKLGTGAVTRFAASGTAITGNPTTTDTYEFSYKVTPGVNQAAGTYEGTAQYVLAPSNQ